MRAAHTAVLAPVVLLVPPVLLPSVQQQHLWAAEELRTPVPLRKCAVSSIKHERVSKVSKHNVKRQRAAAVVAGAGVHVQQ
jgi:hypothetical protein